MLKSRIAVCILLAITLVISYSQPVFGDTTRDWVLVWNDEFNSGNGYPVDTSKWGFDIGDGSDRNIPGWGNNELEYYTNRLNNSYQEDGCLVIKAQQENYHGKSYTSARLVTKNKADWEYGRFEIKAQLPYGKGIWPAIWALPTDNAYGEWPASGELDIMEEIGQEPAKIYGTAHWGNPYQKSGSSFSLNEGSFSDAFHIFALEWDPEQLRWYVDGKLYHSLDKSKPFDKKFHLLLNITVGGNWPGDPDNTTIFPQVMKVDYVRVYQRGTGTGFETWTDWAMTNKKSSTEPWTITFNKKVDSSSIDSNVFVTTDENRVNVVNGVSVGLVDGNACKVKVMPPNGRWQSDTTYYLFISSHVKSSSGGQSLKNGIRMKFNITP